MTSEFLFVLAMTWLTAILVGVTLLHAIFVRGPVEKAINMLLIIPGIVLVFLWVRELFR